MEKLEKPTLIFRGNEKPDVAKAEAEKK